MKITQEEYLQALKELHATEAKLDRLKSITRAYLYDLESERVKNRKADSAKFHQGKDS